MAGWQAAGSGARQGAWVEVGLGHSHGPLLPDIDPGAHDIIRSHDLEGQKAESAWQTLPSPGLTALDKVEWRHLGTSWPKEGAEACLMIPEP